MTALDSAPQTTSATPPARSRPGPRGLLTTWGPLLAIAVVAVVLLIVAPAVLSPFRLNNLGKYICWAIAGVGIGLAWGRGGMLVLGQGVFFGLGGYAMAMHLKLEAAMATGGPDAIPDFMVLYGDATMPWWWSPFRSGGFTLAAIVIVPALVAAILGYAIFKRRVKGAYFAILTQALAVAFATLLIATIKETGGFNGLNQFTLFFGYNLYDPVNKQMIYSIAAVILIVCLVVVWQLYRSRFGELLVATRDAEERVRFLGHDPANIKLFAFVVAAVMASAGGAMFAPISGIISPSDVDATASIFLIAGVALGGRSLLLGPALGALAVGFGRTYFSETFPDQWTYFLGVLFIVVILFFPAGLGSAAGRLTTSLARVRRRPAAGRDADPGRPPQSLQPAPSARATDQEVDR